MPCDRAKGAITDESSWLYILHTMLHFCACVTHTLRLSPSATPIEGINTCHGNSHVDDRKSRSSQWSAQPRATGLGSNPALILGWKVFLLLHTHAAHSTSSVDGPKSSCTHVRQCILANTTECLSNCSSPEIPHCTQEPKSPVFCNQAAIASNQISETQTHSLADRKPVPDSSRCRFITWVPFLRLAINLINSGR